MFPYDLFDQKLAEHARKVREINCFSWMREGLNRGLGGRFGRRKQHASGNEHTSS
jgi:hypothetical protein